MLDEREKQAEVDRHTTTCLDLEKDFSQSSFNPGADLSVSHAIATSVDGPPLRTGRWTQEEKLLFLYGLKRFGKGRWKKMSVYLPHRSLVQIKSHAQKVLKRQEAGEDIFRKLEEQNQHLIDRLVVQAARERDALRVAGINVNTTKPCKSLFAAATKTKSHKDAVVSREHSEGPKQKTSSSEHADAEASGPESVIAAAALCQLSSVGAQWDQHIDGLIACDQNNEQAQ